MPLVAGTRFGPYEIAASLGAGGMGEVWRARDTNLGRDVAIKVLPEAFANDASRVARFEQEAKTLAALNHPHIAQIYGLERAEAKTAIVMELVEGPTLADRIAQGPMPADEALNVAMQILAALEAAHERQIIHRDLKPANIKLRPDGTVKVLDFGIAKALDMRLTSGSQSPLMTTPVTQSGVILGTAAYMAPEQARGKGVDQRADIWAFGCVLYEMLTGQPAFGGEDVTITLARVLERDTNMSTLPGLITPAVRHTIKLCLEKEPKKRLHAIGDVRLALEGRFESGLPGPAAASIAVPLWRRALPLAAAAIVAGLAVGAAVWLGLQPEPEPVRRFAYVLPSDHTFRNLGRPVLAVAPDGRHFAYNTTRGIFLRSMDELDARLIPGTEEGLRGPFFSADGRSIGYFTQAGIKRISISGGAPVVIGEHRGNGSIGAVWASDGTILFGDAEGVYRVPATGGVPELVVRSEGPSRQYVGAFLPDGDAVLVTERRSAGADWDTAEIVAYSVSTGERTVLTIGGSVQYVPSGHLVYALGDTLFGVAFDADTLTLSGGPVPLLQGVMRSGNFTGAANFGVSNDGTLVYVRGDPATFRNTLVWVDRSGREEPIDLPPRNYIYAQLSPDGTRVALDSRDEDADIWVFDLRRATLQRLTFDSGLNRTPVWSPDGTRLAFTREVESEEAAYWQAADGSGVAERLTGAVQDVTDASVTFPSAFLPDGAGLLYSIGTNDVGMVSIGAAPTETPIIAGAANEHSPVVSPDGRWLAYQSNESGRYEIYVRPFPDVDAGRWQISTNEGTRPEWSADGTELFYFREDSGNGAEIVAVPVELGETFRAGTPQALFSGPYVAGQALRGVYDVTSDGQRFLLIKRVAGEREAATQAIVIVENWLEELKRLVPTK